MNEIKTFKKNTWTCFYRTWKNIEGLQYTITKHHNGVWFRVINSDMPKLKALLGNSLYTQIIGATDMNYIEILSEDVEEQS